MPKAVKAWALETGGKLRLWDDSRCSVAVFTTKSWAKVCAGSYAIPCKPVPVLITPLRRKGK